MKLSFKVVLLIIFLVLSFFFYKELRSKSDIERRYNNSDSASFGQSPESVGKSVGTTMNAQESSKKEEGDREVLFDKTLASLQDNDIFIGDKGARVVMIEYDSLTCPHCKDFHDKIFDSIRKKYIDTGKVLYISRAFPTDGMSFRLALAVMCGFDNEEKLKLRTLVFNNQQMIYRSFEGTNFDDRSEKNMNEIKNKAENAIKGFLDIFEMAGFDRSKMEACMDPEKSTENRDILLAQSGQAFKSPYRINSAPTFLVNGKMYNGAQTIEFWEQIIDKELALSQDK